MRHLPCVRRKRSGDANEIIHWSKPLQTAIVRRQDAPKCYDMNASIYVRRRAPPFEAATLFNPDTRLYVMPEERSIDIDSGLDFKFVEYLMSAVKLANNPNE